VVEQLTIPNGTIYCFLMSIAEIRLRLTDEFKPCRIETTNGREYAIPHSDWVLIGTQSLAVLKEDGQIAWVAPEHVVAIREEPLNKAGTKKRR
jgi:hypothetical protein